MHTGTTHLYSQHKLLIMEDNQIALQLQVGSSCPPLKSHRRGPGWWKGKLIYFGFQQLGWGVDTCPKAPPPLTIILKPGIGGLTGVLLTVSGRVSLQFQSRFVPFPGGQFSELCHFCRGSLVITQLPSPTWYLDLRQFTG